MKIQTPIQTTTHLSQKLKKKKQIKKMSPNLKIVNKFIELLVVF